MTGQGRLHWAPYSSGLEADLLPHAEVRIQDSPDTARERAQPGRRNRGSANTPELVERQTMLVLGNPLSQRCRLGEHHHHSGLHMGR